MPENKIHILVTRPVETEQVKKAKQKGINIDVLSFIETEAIQDIEVQQEIEWASVEETTVVFTSMNAVEAVTGMLDGFVPQWHIYCMGYKTKQLVSEYFGEEAIAGTADNALELAEEIIENEEPEEVIFFCGNQRRDELPGKLQEHKIVVNEIIVYETTAIEHIIERVYNGILFFSPSAVDSFFKKNVLPEHTIVFAIGNTTSNTVKKYCTNKILISKLPGKDEMVEQAIAYFS
ncbi:MAG: uroporphyrinogen-III synthase [Sediminibacterium sp.]